MQINNPETQSLSDSSVVTQTVSGRAAIQAPVKLVLYPLSLLTTCWGGDKAQLPPVDGNWDMINPLSLRGTEYSWVGVMGRLNSVQGNKGLSKSWCYSNKGRAALELKRCSLSLWALAGLGWASRGCRCVKPLQGPFKPCNRCRDLKRDGSLTLQKCRPAASPPKHCLFCLLLVPC